MFKNIVKLPIEITLQAPGKGNFIHNDLFIYLINEDTQLFF